jgi:hypothetical protein
MKASAHLNRWRPRVGIATRITDAELITVSVIQALLGYHNASRWIRFAAPGPAATGPPLSCAVGGTAVAWHAVRGGDLVALHTFDPWVPWPSVQ